MTGRGDAKKQRAEIIPTENYTVGIITGAVLRLDAQL